MVRDRTASKWNGELAKVWWVRHEEISIDNIKDIKERAAMFWRESPPTHISNSSQSTHSTFTTRPSLWSAPHWRTVPLDKILKRMSDRKSSFTYLDRFKNSTVSELLQNQLGLKWHGGLQAKKEGREGVLFCFWNARGTLHDVTWLKVARINRKFTKLN